MSTGLVPGSAAVEKTCHQRRACLREQEEEVWNPGSLSWCGSRGPTTDTADKPPSLAHRRLWTRRARCRSVLASGGAEGLEVTGVEDVGLVREDLVDQYAVDLGVRVGGGVREDEKAVVLISRIPQGGEYDA